MFNSKLIGANSTGGGGIGASFYTQSYIGTGPTQQSITGFGFRPDIVWIKNRNRGNSDPFMWNVNRGYSSILKWNSQSGAYNPGSSGILQLDDGITVRGATLSTNFENDVYDVFAWKAGGPPVTNNDGNKTTTVSANVEAGISVVTFQNVPSSNGRTFGHGLSQAPEMIIAKKNDGTSYWFVGGTQVGLNKAILMDSSADNITTDTQLFQNITSTTFGLGSNTQLQGDITVLCFHSVDGFSQIGNYNGTTTVPTSFAPKFFMGNATTCGAPTYCKGIQQQNSGLYNDKFYDMTNNAAETLGPGLKLNADSFNSYLSYNNRLNCNNVFYATFGNDNI